MRPLMIIAGEKLVGEAERELRMVEERKRRRIGEINRLWGYGEVA